MNTTNEMVSKYIQHEATKITESFSKKIRGLVDKTQSKLDAEIDKAAKLNAKVDEVAKDRIELIKNVLWHIDEVVGDYVNILSCIAYLGSYNVNMSNCLCAAEKGVHNKEILKEFEARFLNSGGED